MPSISDQLVEAVCSIEASAQARKNLPALLKTFRHENKLSQQALADVLSVSAGFICDVEGGNRSMGLSLMQQLKHYVIHGVLANEQGRDPQ